MFDLGRKRAEYVRRPFCNVPTLAMSAFCSEAVWLAILRGCLFAADCTRCRFIARVSLEGWPRVAAVKVVMSVVFVGLPERTRCFLERRERF